MANNRATAANILPGTAGVVHTDGELYGLSGGRRRTAALHGSTNNAPAHVVPTSQRPADDTHACSGGGGYNWGRERRRPNGRGDSGHRILLPSHTALTQTGPPPYCRPHTLPVPIIPWLLGHQALLPTWARSPDTTRTYAMQSSDICGRETYPAGNPPDCLSPLDDDPPVHHNAQSTGPSAQRPRHPVHSGSRTDNYHTSGPPVRQRWAGCLAPVLYLTMVPLHALTSQSARLPRDLPRGRCRREV